jgi:hypothetical protein
VKPRIILIFSMLASMLQPVWAEAPWTIVSASDWHSAEGGVTSPNPQNFERNQASERRLITGTVACKPEVVIIAGDMGSGHWTMGQLRKAGILQQGETIEAAIHRLGDKTYRSMRENFAAAGVKRLWVCVGDHGLGDNDWAPGSERSKCVPFHREIFGKSYNMADGEWLWPARVCGVPARPLGTPYENTSFAACHKNALFVQVDIFHQKDPGQRVHPRHGSIKPDLEGDHLAWFRTVLDAARNDPKIKYIFVQAHTPCLAPVRAQSSSMMMVTDSTDSNLWQAMRSGSVDLFFAGEVHATTVSKDPQSDLIQVVTDRHMPTMITVHEDKLVLQCFDRSLGPDGEPKPDARHAEHTLTIHKTPGKMAFSNAKGVLKPLDTQAIFLHYSFDGLKPTPLGSRQGSVVLNRGELDTPYHARARQCQTSKGQLGSALTFAPGGTVHVNGTGPFGFFDQSERTFCLWFKTQETSKTNLICAGSGLKGNHWGGTGFMDLVLDRGRLSVRTSAGETRLADPPLNNGQWHHVALVVMPNARTLAHVRVYVDGQRRDWAVAAAAEKEITARMGIYGMSLAGPHRPVWKKGKLGPFTAFEGAIDDFAAWYRALSDAEIKQLYDLAVTKQMNASQVDEQFRREQE